ncbi:5'-AMP-activated protein kinase-like protein isoform X1 [Carex rostrata]
MVLSTAPPAFFFLFSRSAKPSSIPTATSASVSFSRSSLAFPSLQLSKARRRDGEDDAFSSGRAYQKLEEEIFEFMRRSKKPDVFPTKEELIESGKRDLAEAVVAQGGWLAFGWDLEKERGKGKYSCDSNSAVVEENAPLGHENKIRDCRSGGHPDYPEVSVSGRSMDGEESTDNTGVEGILKRIEKQRSLIKDRKGYGQPSYNKHELDPGGASFSHKHPLEINKMSNKPNALSPIDKTLHDYRIMASKNGRSSISNGSVNSSTSDRWTGLSVSNDNSSSYGSEAGKIVLTEERTTLDSETLKDGFDNGRLHTSAVHNGNSGSRKETSLEMGDIRQRIHHLESSLNSALDSVRSRVKKVLSHKLDETSAAELNNLSDDWEFRETEILKTKDEVRSLRARLSVFEGKMALQMIEAQKLLEENQKRLDEARRALSSLRNISIVWPSPASEVLLAGSFDGWTSKRRMEQSREGIFSLNLMLYPGKYEIKFIVDGVWTVDPLRPVVNHSGHENNILTVV